MGEHVLGVQQGKKGSFLEQRAEACCQQQDRFIEEDMASPLPSPSPETLLRVPRTRQSRNEGQITSDLPMGLS